MMPDDCYLVLRITIMILRMHYWDNKYAVSIIKILGKG